MTSATRTSDLQSGRSQTSVVARSEPVVIEPPRGLSLNPREVWRYRGLALLLMQRAIKPLYRQTILGFGWAILPPFVLMIVFSVFFHNVAGVPSQQGVPYPIFSFSGLLLWQYFTVAATTGSAGLIANSTFLTKIYFPRLLLPLSSVLAALFNLFVASAVIVALMGYYRYSPTWQMLAAPAFVLLAAAAALAISLWFSAASVRFRDLSLAVPLMLQALLFATPVIYPITIFSSGWQTVVSVMNPMAPAVEGFRWAMLGRGDPPGWTVAAAAGIVMIALLGGIAFFNRMERTFADTV